MTTTAAIDEDLSPATLVHSLDGHGGSGWYSWDDEYADEGSIYWGETKPTPEQLAEAGQIVTP